MSEEENEKSIEKIENWLRKTSSFISEKVYGQVSEQVSEEVSEEKQVINNYLYEIEKYLRDIVQDRGKEETFLADIENIKIAIENIRKIIRRNNYE